MHVNLPVTTSIDYFEQEDLEIDWEETHGENMISVEEANDVQHILTCETSLFMLRRSTGFCGSLVDDMVKIRRSYINAYEKKYGKTYVEHNDFM